MKRFCGKCGTEAGANTAFCENCGARIEAAISGGAAAQPIAESTASDQSFKGFVVASLDIMTTVFFFVLVIGFGIAGYYIALMMQKPGFVGFIVASGVGTMVATQVTGLIYVQLSINERLRDIKELLQSR